MVRIRSRRALGRKSRHFFAIDNLACCRFRGHRNWVRHVMIATGVNDQLFPAPWAPPSLVTPFIL
jgi:hypothetical protein